MLSTHQAITDHSVVLYLAGEIDLAAVSQLRAHIDAAVSTDRHLIVLNLQEVTFCDATGLSFFLQTRRRLQATGRTLLLQAPQPRVRQLLAMTRMDETLTIHAT